MKVILTGYRATGKTVVGMLLSKKMKLPFVDTDRLIERAAGLPIRDIVAQFGWEEFRRREACIVATLPQMPPCVVSTGGGVILSAANREALKQAGTVIWLKLPAAEIVRRLQHDGQTEQTRPAFTSDDLEKETQAVLAQRLPLYEQTADFAVDTQGKSIVRVADDIYELLVETGVVAGIGAFQKKSRKTSGRGTDHGG
mgnify:FL=1